MENVLTITNLKPNTLEFEAGLEGIDNADMKIRLIIEAKEMDLGFDAVKIKGTKWEVTIPPLPMLEKTAYPFRIDVVSDGYFFDPLHGTMNVVGTHELYVTGPSNKNILPRTPIEGKKDQKNKQSVKPDSRVASPVIAAPTVDKKSKVVVEDKSKKSTTTFEEAIAQISKPIPRHVAKKRKPMVPKVLEKNNGDVTETIDSPAEEVEDSSTTKVNHVNEAVKSILAEDKKESTDGGKKVLTHPIKKKGIITYH